MPDRIDVAEKVIASVVGLGAVAKMVQWIHNSISGAVTRPILIKMEEQIELGLKRDEHIAALKRTLDAQAVEFAATSHSIKVLEKEWKPNCGSSALDRITKIYHMVEAQGATVLALHQDNPQGIFLSDLQGRCVWVNATLLRITGRSEDEMLGWNWINQLDETEVNDIRLAWDLSFRESREYKRLQTYVTPSGAKIKTSVVARPIYGPDDSILKWVGFVHELP